MKGSVRLQFEHSVGIEDNYFNKKKIKNRVTIRQTNYLCIIIIKYNVIIQRIICSCTFYR